MKRISRLLAPALAIFLCAAGAHGAASDRQVQDSIGFDQRIGAELPRDATFTDADGKRVRLGDIAGARPIVLVMAWYECRTLCGMVLNNIASTLAQTGFTPGVDYDVVTVSIDPTEGPEEARKTRGTLMTRHGTDDASGWHVLTGDEGAIEKLAGAIGFRYTYNEDKRAYAHPAGIVLAGADGTVARYLFGLDPESRNLRLALIETADGKLGSPIDQLVLRCHRFDPERGEYNLAIMNALRLAGGSTTALLAGMIGWWMMRERRGRKGR